MDKSKDPPQVFLGTHTAEGAFPGRMTGLCAAFEGQGEGDDPEGALVEAAVGHGLSLSRGQLERRAVFEFIEADQPGIINEDWLCYAELDEVSVDATQSGEGLTWVPEWTPIDAIPYHRMPVDDAVWYPPFIEGKNLGGRFSFDGIVLSSCAVWELNDEDRIQLTQQFEEGQQLTSHHVE